jgi:nicotinamidase/pyrazinamidase
MRAAGKQTKMSKAKNSALIVVDVQRDFCEGGALAASDTLSLLAPLQQAIEKARCVGATIVFTKDWHPASHSSFTPNGGPWPVHCVENSAGAELMPPIAAAPEDIIVHKGIPIDGPGYSGFDDTGLASQLAQRGVSNVAVTGVATEYCVRATALGAAAVGFSTVVLEDVIRAVNANETEKTLSELKNSGVNIATAKQWLDQL